jgi:hypothetical protein
MEQKRSNNPGRPKGPSNQDWMRAIRELHWLRKPVPEITRRLANSPGGGPSEATVRRYVATIPPDDDSGPWSLGARSPFEEPVDAAEVLRVVRFLIEQDDARPPITWWQAVVISRIAGVRHPSEAPARLWNLARELISAQQVFEDKEGDHVEAWQRISAIHAFLALPAEAWEARVVAGVYPQSIGGTAIKKFTVDAVIAANSKAASKEGGQ